MKNALFLQLTSRNEMMGHFGANMLLITVANSISFIGSLAYLIHLKDYCRGGMLALSFKNLMMICLLYVHTWFRTIGGS